ncbi:hypothetical protein QAD02_011117 [Eretmocerus hayati]|uniref:Uncharacterized protein n=1 Tax=Eretmocerus hayati TaxID=131215 RepID=A0ACC2NX09_9HYME|nr:hypothetical protein QAD02_011117 [Eretmocerus hayati]
MSRADGSYFITYALAPIKAGSPFRTALPPSVYEFEPKAERQKKFCSLYNSSCDCKACTDDWPEKLAELIRAQKMILPQSKADLIYKLRLDIRSLSSEYFRDFYKMSYPDIKDIAKIRSMIEQTWEHLEDTMPSPMIVTSVKMLSSMYQIFFSSTDINSKKACCILGKE